MTCLLKTKENKRLLEEYTKIVGSEDAAYYLLCANNGLPLNKTPQGEDSALYSALMDLYGGNKKEAIMAKAQAYLPEMGDWVDHPESTTLLLDLWGEPSIKYLTSKEGKDVSTTWNSEDVSLILGDEGALNKTLNVLRDNNVIDREVPIQNAVRSARNRFVDAYLQELSKNEVLSPVGRYLHSQDARDTWNRRKKDELIKLMLTRLAKAFNLRMVKKGTGVYFEGDDNSITGKLRVKFVNNIQKYIDNAYEDTKGAYVEDINHELSIMYISLLNGDHTTVIHELAHRYVRNFWETQPVQDALQVVRKRKDLNAIPVEERLVNKIVDMLMKDEKQSYKFFKGIKKVLSKVFALYSNKLEILDDLTAYFAINEDISNLQAETIYLAKIYEPVFLLNATKKEKKLLDEIKEAVDIRIKAFVHDPLKNNKTLSELRSLDMDLQALDSEDQKDVVEAIKLILANCENELKNTVSSIMAKAELEGYDKLDIALFARLKTNTLGYYSNLLNGKINLVFKGNRNAGEFSTTSDLYRYYDHVSSTLSIYLKAYERIADGWVDWYIDRTADELVTFADKEIWKTNAKHWVRNEIGGGGLGFFNKMFGAINSNSPIVNIVDHLIRRANNYVRPAAEEVGHHLTSLFDSYTNHVDVLPFNQFRDFCELSYRRDFNGKRGLTGNFRRSENWGEMQFAIDREKKRIAKELGIELDENLRFDWRTVDRDTYNEYYNRLDDFYEQNDIVRKFKPEYYRTLRKYMSPETIEIRKEILEQIDIIESKCKNQQTGVFETFKLTSLEREKLKSLKKQKKDLANPYNIVLDEFGNFLSIELKDPGTLEGKIAEEIIAFNDAVRGKIRYIPDWEKYNEDRQKLIDSGASDSLIKMWEWDNTMHKIREGVITSGGSRGEEIAQLYAQRLAIIEATKSVPGHWNPNLSKLNIEAWQELRDIDAAISDFENEDGYTKPKGSVDPDSEVSNVDVFHYEGDVLTDQTEYNYQFEKYQRASQVNPRAIDDFRELFHYPRKEKVWDAAKHDYSTIFIETPLTAFKMLNVGAVKIGDLMFEGVVDEPSGHYVLLDKSSALVEDGFDDTQSAYIQPRKNGKWHDSEFEKLYGDGTTKYAKMYDYMIQVMGEIYSNYGMNDVNKYQLPGIRDSLSHSWQRRGRFSLDNIKLALKINESDVNYNEEVSLRPDGTEIHVIPMRWVRKLDNPNLTSTDLVATITAMYEASLNYKEKNEILPVIQTLMVPMGLSFFRPSDAKIPDLLQQIQSHIEAHVFGRKRRGDKYVNPTAAKAADWVMNKAHSKLMAHNWKVILKNGFDSFWNFNKEMAGGKYFTVKDALAADLQIAKEFFINIFRNIGMSNGRTLTGAILNRNNVIGTVSELFKGQRSSGIRRFLAKYFKMGEYSLIDYMFKGNIALSIYHNHRLIINPLTGRQLFMNQWEAAYVYSKAGQEESDGIKAWRKAGNLVTGKTLLDAYYVDKEGNLTLKDEYLDIVRPEVNGKRSNLLETRIETIIRERSSVINGVLDEMDRPAFMQMTLGAMVGQMRGWMFSQSADNFKGGTQFLVREEDLDELGFEANTEYKGKGGVIKKGYIADEYKLAFANLSTGFVESGAQRRLLRSYGRCIGGLIMLHRYTSVHKATKQDKYRVNMMNVSLLSMAITIALGVLFGKMVEDDPDDWFANFAYAVNTGAMSERVSQLPMGVVISMLELIRSPFVATALYLDAGSVLAVIGDAIEYYRYQQGWANDPSFDDEVKRGGYSSAVPFLDVPMTNWMRDAMKASSVLFPDYSINNMYKNTSNSSNISSANFYNDQFPVNILNYRPNRGYGRTRSNWITDIFEEGDVSRILNWSNPFNAD